MVHLVLAVSARTRANSTIRNKKKQNIMKKLFVSILALAAFAACQSDFNNDVNLGAPQGGSANVGGSHTVYAEVGVGEETKATYGEGLVATWEENDQIALLQENANYGATFSVVNKLNIKEGWGTSKALFSGEISVDATAPRVYHIAYPASAVEFSTAMSQSVVVTKYDDNVGWNVSGYEGQSTGYGVCTYNSTLNITVPTTQNGKWEPYMYASTSEAVAPTGIGAKTLTTLTGAIAIRAFEADGVTPKQLKQITITSSDAAIAGTFSGTAQSVGNTATVTGAKTGGHYNESVREENALKNLTSALQSYEATSTTVTKAMSSLTFNGTGNSIIATDLTSIAADANGVYTYHINVAPVTLAAGTLTIVAVAADGSNLERVIDDKDVKISASHRAGFNLRWESATLKCDAIDSWYDDWNKGSQFQLADNTLYVDNIIVDGNIAPENVKVIGIKINDVLHEDTAQSGVKELSPIVLSGMASGVYKVQPVAQVELNGKLVWLEGGAVTKTITAIPTITDYSVITSYSNNGKVAKDNKINGDILKVKANISDSYVANNLVNGKTYTFCYGSNTTTHTLGAEEKEIKLAHGAWGQYDCYVKITLNNGYVLESAHYTTHVTGIPYSYAFYKDGSTNIDAAKSAGWSFTGTGTQSDQVWICKANSVGIIGSPKFHAPTNVDTKNTLSHRFYYIGSGSINAYVGASSSPSSAVKTATFNVGRTLDTGETGGLSTHVGNDANVVLTPSNPYITITSDSKGKYSTAYHYVHAIKIEYR